MKVDNDLICKIQWVLFTSLVLSSNSVFAQVSPLQQPQTFSGTPNQAPGNVIEKLFSNPGAASSYAGLYANPNSDSPYASVGGVPKLPGDFWGGLFHRHIVDAGTILNGTLDDDLSSKTSKIGDTFSILLADGYKSNNVQLIPANAKIVGTVNSVAPANQNHNGIAGSLQVTLQTLVLPDSSSVPISASIMYNPNQPGKIDMKKGRGIPIGEYAQSFEYSVFNAAGNFTRTMGLPLPIKTQTAGGPDFIIKKGQLLPVKLTQPLDMTAYMKSQPAQASGNQTPNPQAPNAQALNAQSPNMVPVAPPIQPANIAPTPSFGSPPVYQNPQNSNYPAGWPGGQPMPGQTPGSTNVLPGNNDPAGPDPF